MEIREAVPADAERIRAIYAPYVTQTAITFEWDVPTLAEMEWRIRQTMERYPYLVLVENSKVYGYAYAGVFAERSAYAWSCEVSIYLDRAVLRRGYGKQLYQDLKARLQTMGLQNLYACIAMPAEPDPYLDEGSALFHAACGYAEVGRFHRCGYKFGRWYDMIWMEKHIGTHPTAPREIW